MKNINPIRTLTSLVLGLTTATALCAPPSAPVDTEGWGSTWAEVVKDQQGVSFVRLDLEVDRGYAGLNYLANLEPGRSYDLKIEYQSSDEVSGFNVGSWIYIAYRDGKDKGVGEDCKILEKAASWVSKSFPCFGCMAGMEAQIPVQQSAMPRQDMSPFPPTSRHRILSPPPPAIAFFGRQP